jgi:hypothetical protein
MKKLISLFLIIINFSIIYSQEYYQYFDGGDTIPYYTISIHLDTSSNNIWQIGKPHKTIFDSASTVPNAIVTDTINFYPINNTSSFIAKIKNNFGLYGVFAFQWVQKLDFDKTNEGGVLEYLIDTNDTWVNIFNNGFVYNLYGFDSQNQGVLPNGKDGFVGTDSTWKNVWLCFSYDWLSQMGNLDTLQFRFTIYTDSVETNQDGWMIDNMMSHLTYFHTLKEVERENYLTVYPNPANKTVAIELEKQTQFHIIEQMELIDENGKLIEKWQKIPTKFWFNTEKYKNGTYTLKVKSNLKETQQMIIIQH